MSTLMRRAAPGLALAGVALSTVWLFDPALRAHEAAAAGATTDQGQSSDPGSGTGTTDPTDPDSSDPDTSGSDSSSDSGASTDSGSSTASNDCSAPQTVTGDAAMTRWGPVQVQVQFAADGSVCSVRAIAYPDSDPHSSRINATAIPYLDQQASQVGVSFDSISGATYTSEAYRQSLQSALDQR